MDRKSVIERLRASEANLRAQGVLRAALFGSVARGDQSAASDIDILVEVDPDIVATMFDYANLKDYVASLFQGPVDVVDLAALKARVRPRVTAEAVYAF